MWTSRAGSWFEAGRSSGRTSRLPARTSPQPPYIAAGSPWNWAVWRPSPPASYYAFPDLEDFEDILGEWLPLTPTLLSMSAMSLPTGGSFFTNVGVLHGPPGPLNSLQTARMLVDTGAESSIISSNMAASLNLPLEPDFTAQICGVGGASEVPGYYVDYVRINAQGGTLEFSHVPFVVLDMESSEGGSLDGILGMNFFWNRNLVLEPTTTGSAFLHVSDPVPYAYIDLNFDDAVDVADFAIFASAWGATPADPAWNSACDFYLDEVIDARDLRGVRGELAEHARAVAPAAGRATPPGDQHSLDGTVSLRVIREPRQGGQIGHGLEAGAGLENGPHDVERHRAGGDVAVDAAGDPRTERRLALDSDLLVGFRLADGRLECQRDDLVACRRSPVPPAERREPSPWRSACSRW